MICRLYKPISRFQIATPRIENSMFVWWVAPVFISFEVDRHILTMVDRSFYPLPITPTSCQLSSGVDPAAWARCCVSVRLSVCVFRWFSDRCWFTVWCWDSAVSLPFSLSVCRLLSCWPTACLRVLRQVSLCIGLDRYQNLPIPPIPIL